MDALSKHVGSRDNNFNLIRVLAASAVLITHGFALSVGSREAEPQIAGLGMTMGSVAVDVFFVTSGFLVTASLLSRGHLVAFLCSRFLRIYPALIVAVLLSVFGVGLFFTSQSVSSYLGDPQTLRYLTKNVSLFFGVTSTLPGVFADNPYQAAVNGSLWTRPYEVWMYAILATIWALGRLLDGENSRLFERVTVFLACASVALNIFAHFVWDYDSKFLPLFSMFFSGTAYFIQRDKVPSSPILFVSLSGITICALSIQDALFVAYTLFLPYCLLFLAYVQYMPLLKFNLLGDYSYGIYIYAFPVQQSIAALIPKITVLHLFIISFSITAIVAVLSWHFIEKGALRLKERTIAFFGVR